MPPPDGTEPVAYDERLYRRIPVSKGWYSADGLSPEAFDPRDDETTGISFYRDKYKSIAEAGTGLSRSGYYVAVFRAGDLTQAGIVIAPRPKPGDPGHTELPELTCHNRLTREAQELKLRLTELFLHVEGPFLPAAG